MVSLTRLCSVLTTLLFTVAASSNDTDEIALIKSRRRSDLSQFPTIPWFESIPTWLATQTANGTWSDVDYTSGCPAQRANWPIQNHWIRLITFAAAWSGLNPAAPANYTADPDVLAAALRGMDWWFANDFTAPDCMAEGGVSTGCPCGTPGLWNGNWFDQYILIPQLVSTACLLVSTANLTEAEVTGCYNIPYRPYALRDSTSGIGILTGANMINVMQNSVSLALFVGNDSILSDALDRAMQAVTFSDLPAEDGIHRDGSFLQHAGILYNGNYGKDLLNAFIQLEGETIGTSFAANESTRTAFATDVQGGEWMIYVDSETKQEHWDMNVIGRFISFPTSDLQASADINFNVTKLAAATNDFTGSDSLNDTISRLESNGTEKLVGNRGFWASDYMVHRREDFIITNKMLSNRSTNSEYTNSANPYGYHLGQGTLFSYVSGYEYRDIQAAWDWNLIPGTTVLLDVPELSPSLVSVKGNRTYVGEVSDGSFGASAMDYIDPHYGNLAYRKAWFFLDNSVLVTTSAVTTQNTSAPVISVLDQRAAASGGFTVDGKSCSTGNISGQTLFYGGNGYLSHDTPFNLTVFEGTVTGNWSAISTSTAGVETVDLFSAYTTVPKGTTYSYEFFPSSSAKKLKSEAAKPTTTPLDIGGTLGAAGAGRLALVFWPGSQNNVTVDLSTIGWSKRGSFSVSTSSPGAFLFTIKNNKKGSQTLTVTLSDPSQSLTSLTFSIASSGLNLACQKPKGDDGCSKIPNGLSFEVDLPTGGLAGSSVFKEITLK